MYREVVQDPKVELCFNGSEKMVRVSGMAEFIEDQGLKEEVVKARPFLKPLVDAHGWVAIKVFRVAILWLLCGPWPQTSNRKTSLNYDGFPLWKSIT